MGQIQVPKKIKVEDFPSDQQSLVSKLGYIFNDFSEGVYYLLQKGIDFTNLNRQIITFTLNIDSSGKIINPPQLKYNLKTNPQGITVVNAQNVNNPEVYTLTAPLVSWTNQNGLVLIQNVTGLQPGSKYTLTLELIG